MSDFSDFDPANISSSSDAELPAKRKPEISLNNLEKSELPDPLELLNKARLNRPVKTKEDKVELVKDIKNDGSVIRKEPVLKKYEGDALEQYDYFANAGDAVLEH